MKTVLVFVLGVVAGGISTYVILNPDQAAQKAHQGVATVQTSVQELQHDHCRRQYLDETHCYQKIPAKECDARIVERCGVPK